MEEKLQKNENQKENTKGMSRRDFFKSAGIAGLAAGAVGTGSLINAKPALAGEKTGRPIVDFAVQEINTPSYKLYPFAGAEKLQRFDEAKTAFNQEKLKKEKFGGKPWVAIAGETALKKLKMDNPPAGYTLIDLTLYDAGWTSYRGAKQLFSWEPIGVANLSRLKEVGRWKASPEENNQIIKKAAEVYGAGQTGVTTLNEQWFYSQTSKGVPIVFSDKHQKPQQTEEAWYIPKSMKTLIVMVIPMYEPHMKYVPSAMSEGAIGTAYSQMAETASKMAEFLRGIGYNAIPMGNDTGLSVPMAIDAGLGELGRHGLLINPLYGSWLRICKVLTDLPAAPDKPIEFGAAKFCRTCMKCAEKCPSESISKEKDPSTEVKCPSNNPGMKKWYVNTWTCLEFWTENGGGCNICQGVCPYNKPKTWIHDVVKGVSSKTTAFNGTFATLDDVLGYGSTVEDNDPWKWWKS